MALFSRADFARECGVNTAYITVNVQRGKLILSGDYIDDTIAENALFREKRLMKAVGSSKNAGKNESGLKVGVPEKKKPKTPNTKMSESEERHLEVARRLNEQKLLEKEVSNRIKLVQEQKLRKELIPTNIVKSLFAQHSQSIIMSFKNCVEDVITTISKKKALTNEEVADLRGQMVNLINSAVDLAVDTTEKSITNELND